MVSEAQLYALVDSIVAFMKSVNFAPGFSLYLVVNLLWWASAAGTVLWFTLDRMGDS